MFVWCNSTALLWSLCRTNINNNREKEHKDKGERLDTSCSTDDTVFAHSALEAEKTGIQVNILSFILSLFQSVGKKTASFTGSVVYVVTYRTYMSPYELGTKIYELFRFKLKWEKAGPILLYFFFVWRRLMWDVAHCTVFETNISC